MVQFLLFALDLESLIEVQYLLVFVMVHLYFPIYNSNTVHGQPNLSCSPKLAVRVYHQWKLLAVFFVCSTHLQYFNSAQWSIFDCWQWVIVNKGYSQYQSIQKCPDWRPLQSSRLTQDVPLSLLPQHHIYCYYLTICIASLKTRLV